MVVCWDVDIKVVPNLFIRKYTIKYVAYLRTKKIKGNIYYYLVQSVREGKKVRQIVLAYLGAERPNGEEVRKLKKKHEKTTRPNLLPAEDSILPHKSLRPA
jgi:hypothetical protein